MHVLTENLPPACNPAIGLTDVTTPKSLRLFPNSHLKLKEKLHTPVWILRQHIRGRAVVGHDDI